MAAALMATSLSSALTKSSVRKRHFSSTLYVQTIILPRQACEKHGKTKKSTVFCRLQFGSFHWCVIINYPIKLSTVFSLSLPIKLSTYAGDAGRGQSPAGMIDSQWAYFGNRSAAPMWKGLKFGPELSGSQKNGLLAPLYTKNAHFTETGSGQT
jgi:hypothetical protein